MPRSVINPRADTLRRFARVGMPEFTNEAVLAALFLASFVAATVLPGGSEVALLALIHARPELLWPAIAVATVGNTLGSATTYWIGRLIPNDVQTDAVARLRRFGAWALLFAWLPVIGDALALAAGWLRLNPWWSLLALAIGKLLRYLAVAGAWIGLAATLAGWGRSWLAAENSIVALRIIAG
jgi:membrane protein YqaA with SNARE-associated domain